MCSAEVGVYVSMSQYIRVNEMDKDGEWRTEVELFAVCHLLRTRVYTYSQDLASSCTRDIDPSLRTFGSDTDMGMFLYHADKHYKNVCSILNE